MRALLIDDDERLFELLSTYMSSNDVELSHAKDGGRGLSALETDVFDAVLLDVMMPGLSGLEVLSRLRQKGERTPVIMLTAKGEETDRIVGLELGADDYVAKPFSPRELLARMRAVLRRTQPNAVASRVSVGPLIIDTQRREVEVEGRGAIELTAIEFDLLVALSRRPGRVLARDSLLSEAGRGDVIVSERTVDVHISHLRKKLDVDGLIKTVRGVGYVLADGADAV